MEMKRNRPDVIVGPKPSHLWNRSRNYVNHPDHKAVGEVVLCAVMPDSPTRVQFSELLDEGMEPFEVPALWLGAEDADTYVDITETLDLKLEALACHESQVRDLHYKEWVTRRAAELGAAAGMEYAEGFRTFDFTDHSAEAEETTEQGCWRTNPANRTRASRSSWSPKNARYLRWTSKNSSGCWRM